MSMTEMAITMGLVGLGALGAASLSGNMAAGSKKIQGMVAVSNFASAFNAYLYSKPGCAAIKGLGSLSADEQNLVLNTQPDADNSWNYMGISRFEGGYDGGGKKKTDTMNFDIESLTGTLIKETTPVTDKGAVVLTKGMLKLKARLMVGKKPSEYVYNVPVLVNPSNAVVYCSEEKGLVETCAVAQGKYDPDTKTCELDRACKVRDTWNRLSCTGGSPCSPIFGTSKVNQYTGGFSCPSESTESITQTENWVSQRSCGKKCTQNINNTMVWAVCMQCPP